MGARKLSPAIKLLLQGLIFAQRLLQGSRSVESVGLQFANVPVCLKFVSGQSLVGLLRRLCSDSICSNIDVSFLEGKLLESLAGCLMQQSNGSFNLAAVLTVNG